jgi:hypothetical protein
MWSLLCTSFSFVIFCSFSIALFAFMLLWILKFRKHTQLPTINANYFDGYPIFFGPWTSHPSHSFFTCLLSFK